MLRCDSHEDMLKIERLFLSKMKSLIQNCKVQQLLSLSISIFGFALFVQCPAVVKAACLTSDGGNNCATFDPSTPSNPGYRKLPVRDLDPNIIYPYAGVGVDVSSPDPNFFLSLSDIFISFNSNQTQELFFFSPVVFDSLHPTGTTNTVQLSSFGLPDLTVSNLADFVISYTIPASDGLNAKIPAGTIIDTYLVACPDGLPCVRGAGPSRQKAVKVPAPLPLLGIVGALGYSRKFRKHIKANKLPKVESAIG